MLIVKPSSSNLKDTVTFDRYNQYNIFYVDKLKYKPRLLMKKIFINSTRNFNYENVVNTYRTLNSLGVFKRIEIIPKKDENNQRLLNIIIKLESAKKKHVHHRDKWNHERWWSRSKR